MAEILDFSKLRPSVPAKPEASHAPLADGVDYEYDPKPGSVGVAVSAQDDATLHFTVTALPEDVTEAYGLAVGAVLYNFGLESEPRLLPMLRDQVGDEMVDAFITEFVQRHFVAKALLRTGVMSFTDPELKTSSVPVEGVRYVFEADVLVRPEVELASYEPVKVPFPPKQEVTSKDVTSYLENMADELGTWEEDLRAKVASPGDHVALNFSSTGPDGRPFEQFEGKDFPYIVGTGILGGDFDDEVNGMKPRERRTFSMELPEYMAKGLDGFEDLTDDEDGPDLPVLEVKLQLACILRKVPAAINDAWVQTNMPEAQTLLGLRGRIRTMLERAAEDDQRAQIAALGVDELVKRLNWTVDERYVQARIDELVAGFRAELARQYVTLEAYMDQPGFDRAGWDEQIREQAEVSIKRDLALDALATHLDIQLESEDIAALLSQMAPGSEERTYQRLLDSGQMPHMCEMALRQRAMKWLAETAKDSSGPKLQLV